MTEARGNPVLALGGEALEHALNATLALDPQARDDLAALEGRRVEIAWRGVGLSASIRVDGGRLRVGPGSTDATPDLRIAATLAGAVAMLLPRAAGTLPTGQIDIAGDAELARRIERLAREFSPDFDRAFERTLGPALGFPAARAFREGIAFAGRGAGRFADDLSAFLTTELAVTVSKDELESHYDDIANLRDAVGRIEARIARLGATR